MIDVLFMTFLGLIAGMVSVFWTRVTYRNMLLSFVFHWLNNIDRKYVIKTGNGNGHPFVKFLNCVFCLTPWLVFILETIFIILYTPYWVLAIIGIFGGLGAGNLVCEVVYALRKE